MRGILLEMTTPFSCLCWMLLKCELAHLPIWKLNQLVLVHLFHCRTTVEAYGYYMFFKHWTYVAEEMPLSVLLLTTTLNFSLLTPYWTYKKTNQLFKPVDWNHPALEEKPASPAGNGVANDTLTGHSPTYEQPTHQPVHEQSHKSNRKHKRSKKKVQ